MEKLCSGLFDMGEARCRLSIDGDEVFVTSFTTREVIDRNKGHGSRLMSKLQDMAASEGLTLVLDVGPFNDGLSFEKTREWYKRRGFFGDDTMGRAGSRRMKWMKERTYD